MSEGGLERALERLINAEDGNGSGDSDSDRMGGVQQAQNSHTPPVVGCGRAYAYASWPSYRPGSDPPTCHPIGFRCQWFCRSSIVFQEHRSFCLESLADLHVALFVLSGLAGTRLSFHKCLVFTETSDLV